MLKAVKEKSGNKLIIKLSGSIEESVKFDELVGPLPAELEVNCKEVPRINSLGVKSWIRYFQDCKAKGTQVTFVQCSAAIVEQMNLISNFACGGKIETIYVPYSCPHCSSEFLALFKTEDLKASNLQLPEVNCPKCSKVAEFDDIPEEYFRFIER